MRAEKFLGYNTNPLVSNGAVQANWLPGDRFWYRNQGPNGPEFILVDATQGHQGAGIQPCRGRAALTTAMGKPVAAARLPFTQITLPPTASRSRSTAT